MFQNMDRVLLQQIMGAVENNFFCVLHMLHLGYSETAALNLLTHLYATYVVITNSYGITNEKRFCEAYAPTDPIEVFWRKVDDAVANVDASSAT